MDNHDEKSNPFTPVISMPTSVENAVELKNLLGTKADFISGGTLLQIQWQSGRSMPQHLISLEKIPSLNEININMETKVLSIGALTTLAACRFDFSLQHTFPILGEAVQSVAAPAVRNRGTVGGNIIGSAGDLIPLFLALESTLVFQEVGAIKTIHLWEWLRDSSVSNESLLTKVILPIDEPSNQSGQFFRKVGRRESFTAAVVTVSGKIKWDGDGVITYLKLAVGGGDNKPIRLERAEQFIIGKKAVEVDWKCVHQIICEEISPAQDVFVTGCYRKKVASNLIIAELLSTLTTSGLREEYAHGI